MSAVRAGGLAGAGAGDATASTASASGTLGILMLETRFPRPPGDVGHPRTFAVPVRHHVVRGASPRRVVVDADPRLLAPFIDGARALAAANVGAIITGCGFLARFQRELAAAVAVPVWTSSLLLVAELQAGLGGRGRVGVVTADAASLGPAHLAAVGAPPDTPIAGLAPDARFRATVLDDLPELDEDEARRATVAAARALVDRHPDVRTIVLECTNMPPYADAVRAATGLPVHDITTLVARRFGAQLRGAA